MNYLNILLPAIIIILIWLALQAHTLRKIHDRLALTADKALAILLTKPTSVTLIDVRSPKEFVTGHIPEAINIPLDLLKDSVSKIEAIKPIILVCNSGKRAQKAAEFLQKKRPDLVIQYIKGSPLYNNADGTFTIK